MADILGIGYTPVAEHWGLGLRELSTTAFQMAMGDSGLQLDAIDALVIANALSGNLNQQNHIAAMLADHLGLRGVETFRVEAGDASGGLAVRLGANLVNSGAARYVAVLGVEKVTDLVGHGLNNALATLLDSEYEAAHGATPTAIAGLLMRRYMHEFGLELDAFEGFSINAHANGGRNKQAMFRNQIKPGRFATAPVVAPPVNLFDSAPEGDGAAALILGQAGARTVSIIGSAAASDVFALHNRPDPLFLHAANLAAGRAYEAAGIRPEDVNVLEL
ncbi:MAG: thiolase domain-containing protein, partial [Anaerolineales bacterium]